MVRTARFLALCLLAACQSEPRVNSAWQANAEGHVRDLEGERAHYARESYRLEQQIREDQAACEAVRQRALAQAEAVRAAVVELDRQVGLLHAAEQDLAQARTRSAAVATELAPLRAREAEVATLQKRLQEVQAQAKALQDQVTDAEGELAAAQLKLGAKLQEVEKRREMVRRLDATAEAALRSVGEALGPLLPPAPPAPPPTQPQPQSQPQPQPQAKPSAPAQTPPSGAGQPK